MKVKSPEGRFLDKLKMLPLLAELRKVFPKTVACEGCAVQGSNSSRKVQSKAFSDFEVLATRRRTIHHAALRALEGSADREAQHRNVSHAGLRWADNGDALATAKGSRGAFPKSCARLQRTRHG